MLLELICRSHGFTQAFPETLVADVPDVPPEAGLPDPSVLAVAPRVARPRVAPQMGMSIPKALCRWNTFQVQPLIVEGPQGGQHTVTYPGLNAAGWTHKFIKKLKKRSVLLESLAAGRHQDILIQKVFEVIELCLRFFQQDRASAKQCLEHLGISTSFVDQSTRDTSCSAGWNAADAFAATAAALQRTRGTVSD